MLEELDRDERLRLMRFVCSFAWADLEVQSEEKSFVSKMIRRLDLDDSEKRQVEQWLETPPHPESVDPTQIPLEHRKIFVECMEEVVTADDDITVAEVENLVLFKELLR
ncbi:MAG: TerB family tellurite resistance protein [Myxococcota bacterium]